MNAPGGHGLPASVDRAIERMYARFGRYPLPGNLEPCPECGPGSSAADIAATSLCSLSGRQLDALHVVSLADDALRHFFPRLIELLLTEPAPPFDFVYGLHRLEGRLATWDPAETAVVRRVLDAAWAELLSAHPARLGYLSDTRSLLNLADWCDIPLEPFLEGWQAVDTLTAAMHLADLVSDVCTFETPFGPAAKITVLSWLSQPAIGERLQDAVLAADSEDAALELSTAYELWTSCLPG